MKVSDLLPNLYKNNITILNIINSEEKEFENNLKPNIEQAFLNTFASTSNQIGIEKFEKIFGIKANPSEESLDFRRERILNRLITHGPYTERYLIDKLDSMLGKDNWSYNLDYNNYTLTITSLTPGKAWYYEVLNLLEQIIPCNIVWEVNVYSATWGTVKDSFTNWESIKDKTWQELMDGEWITGKIGGISNGKI